MRLDPKNYSSQNSSQKESCTWLVYEDGGTWGGVEEVAAKLPSKERLRVNCVVFCLPNGAGEFGEN